MSDLDCLRKMYVKFEYLTPDMSDEPQDCHAVVLTKYPEAYLFEWQLPPSIYGQVKGGVPVPDTEILCAKISTEGAGGVILFLQITALIGWEIGYVNKKGVFVKDHNWVRVSMPMMHILKGPMIALMAYTPWKFKAPFYLIRIAADFYKLDEHLKVLGDIMSLAYVKFCPGEIQRFLNALSAYERELNLILRRGVSHLSSGDIANRMPPLRDGTGLFPGTRIA